MAHIRLLQKNEARPLPKWKQRQMKIDAYFNELGITPEEWYKRADKAAQGYPVKLGEIHSASDHSWTYYAPDGYDGKKGDVVGRLRIIPDNEAGAIHLKGIIFENGATTYPGGYASTRRIPLWEGEYSDVPITANPEADIKSAFKYADEFQELYSKVAEDHASVAAQKATTVGKYKWSDVRREINEMTLWDVYDGDRPDITGYLQVNKHPLFAFALYSPSGKVLHTKGLDTRSTPFSKIEVVPVPGLEITKEMADKINAKLSQCKDGEAIGDALWREW